jgi:DNA repair exonuclease SbcCD ATPase subunit
MRIKKISSLFLLALLASLTTVALAQYSLTRSGSSLAALSAQTGQQEAAEKAWNERLKKAREKAKDLERRADQAELEMNRVRNFLFSAEPRDAGTNGMLLNRITELNAIQRRLREEAAIAHREVEATLDEGATRRFRELTLSPTTPSGDPNLEYYTSRYAELRQELTDAEMRTAVMQLRVNDINRRITGNAGNFISFGGGGSIPSGGDNFFLGRLRDELQIVEDALGHARTRMQLAAQQIEDLREEARRAGVPPGLLRE